MARLKPNKEFVDRATAMYADADERLRALQADIVTVSRERALAVALLVDHGLSYAQIGSLLKISPARVGQLILGLQEKGSSA